VHVILLFITLTLLAGVSVAGQTTNIPQLRGEGSLLLAGGNWKVQNAKLIPERVTGVELSRAGFDDNNWIAATVPGTVLASYLNAKQIPDPYFADDHFKIDDDFFTNNDFWYRDTFTVPREYTGRRVWLNFDGINWKADVFVNGSNVGRMDGAFIRGRFDITSQVKPGDVACVAVLIRKVAHPGEVKRGKSLTKWPPNGGILGLDSPTFVSSIGWNWLPTIPGRNIGIWNDVYLSSTGDVSIVDPFVTSTLPDLSTAELSVSLDLTNHADAAKTGEIRGTIGDISFAVPVSLAASETKHVAIDKTNVPQLVIKNPKLWWPNGMGDQPMYQLHLDCNIDNKPSDTADVSFGIRKLAWQTHDNVLFCYINDRRVLLRGGNWGMDEGMLRVDDAGYDLRVRLHKEMNFTMIRNWVGMTGRDGFYNACDKYGILIWDDFWLANPADGPDPEDCAMFMANARDKIRRVRNHPSLVLYCGRNEGYPPKDLDEQMRDATKQLDGTRRYLSHSAADGATGFGPYDVHVPEWYFEHRGMTLHSELGIVAVPPVETLRTFLPPDKLWPINDLWGQHDLSQERGPAYLKRLADSYGEATGVDDFCRKAQMLNLESAKAMLEAWQSHQGSGGVIWMTQSAWPCLICQSYAYDFEPTGAYFGFRKACEPVHILWDSYTNRIKIANDTPRDLADVTAEASVYNLDATKKWSRSKTLSLPATSAKDCFLLDLPDDLSPVYFVKLTLKQKDTVLSENFYWASTDDHRYQALSQLPQVRLSVADQQRAAAGGGTVLRVTLMNQTKSIALGARLKLINAASGERVLPVFYDDNYFSLLPGESRQVQMEARSPDPLKVEISGWNIETETISITR
jgi:hypothetical protein